MTHKHVYKATYRYDKIMKRQENRENKNRNCEFTTHVTAPWGNQFQEPLDAKFLRDQNPLYKTVLLQLITYNMQTPFHVL